MNLYSRLKFWLLLHRVGSGRCRRRAACRASLQPLQTCSAAPPKDLQWLLVLACCCPTRPGPQVPLRGLSSATGPQEAGNSRQALNPTLEKGLRSDTDAAHLVAPEAADSGGSRGQTTLDSSAEEALQIQASSLRDKKMRLRRAKAITTELHLQHDANCMEALLPYYCISSTGCS